METYLPIINQLFSDWLAWAVINQINAGILAGAVFLITAILYSIRVGFLKRKIRLNDKLHSTEQANLSAQIATAQAELKSIQDQLQVNTEQLHQTQKTAETEAERAKNHESLVKLRNEQVSSLVQSLATRFDLGERPVPLMGDIKAEGLWQQHDRVTNLLATRLQSEQQAKAQLDQAYQVETLQRKELESLRDTLQTTLVTQQDQLSKLEQALEDQKSILKVQQDKAEQALAEALSKNQAELARVSLLEQQLQATSTHNPQATQILETHKVEPIVQPEPEVQPKPELIIPEVKPVPAEVALAEVSPVVVPEPVTLPEPEAFKEEIPAATKESGAGLSSRFKGLFAKGPEKAEVTIALPEISLVQAAVTPAALEASQPEPAQSAVKEDKSFGFGKLKGLLGRGKAENVDTAPVSVSSPADPEPVPTPAPVQLTPVVIEPVVTEPTPVVAKETSSGFAGKFKGLLGKKAPEEAAIKETESVAVVSPVIETKIEPIPEPVAEVEPEPYQSLPEQNPINFVKDDIARTKAMISNLFGKKK